MFTGLIEEKGTVISVSKNSLLIQAKTVLCGTKIGDSIAVNGVCLTVQKTDGKTFLADVMPETFSRSNLGRLKAGTAVNLERAMPADGRFGGHIVTGHIDGVGNILKRKEDGIAVRFWIGAEEKIMNLIVEKGSVAVDGISLTVAEISSQSFCVSVIPHTLKETVLAEKHSGDSVNIESDILGKYVQKFFEAKSAQKEKEKKLLEWLES